MYIGVDQQSNYDLQDPFIAHYWMIEKTMGKVASEQEDCFELLSNTMNIKLDHI